MSIHNTIAQLGMQMGQNTQNTVMNALATRENRKRYEDQRNMLVQKREDALRKEQEEKERLADQKEIDYTTGWVKAYQSAPEDMKAQVFQGGLDGAFKAGYLTPAEMNGVDPAEFMARASGKVGFDYTPSYKGSNNELDNHNTWLEIANAPKGTYPQPTVDAARIKLKLDPPAVGNSQITLAGSGQGLVDRVAKVEETLAKSKSSGTAEGKGQEVRAQDEITRGLELSKSIPAINRGIELLDLVETGGVDAAAIRAKQIFGIESADEGELSNLVGKAVLSQLRETFGAAFTAAEGERLTRIEAGLGKNNATNRRLLNNALTIAKMASNRARRMAEDRGDVETVTAIDEYMKASLGQSNQGQKPSSTPSKSDPLNLGL